MEEIKERGAFNKMKISVIRYLRRGVGTLTQQISIRRLLPPAVTIKELMAWKHSQVRSMKTKLTLAGAGRYSAWKKKKQKKEKKEKSYSV